MTTLYVSGPMRGHDDLNYPAFDAAAAALVGAGYEVINPADDDRGFRRLIGRPPTLRQCFQMDTSAICHHADGIAVLTGWTGSLGAKAEVALADAIGIPVDFVSGWVAKAKGEA